MPVLSQMVVLAAMPAADSSTPTEFCVSMWLFWSVPWGWWHPGQGLGLLRLHLGTSDKTQAASAPSHFVGKAAKIPISTSCPRSQLSVNSEEGVLWLVKGSGAAPGGGWPGRRMTNGVVAFHSPGSKAGPGSLPQNLGKLRLHPAACSAVTTEPSSSHPSLGAKRGSER